MTPVALQIWTVRDEYRRDPAGTLRRVAELGYEGVELVDWLGFGDFAAGALRAFLDELGLRAAAVHAELGVLEADLGRLSRACRELGAAHVVCAWVPENRRDGVDAYVALARTLAAIGERCTHEGVRLAYHHHDFELETFDGTRGLDVLLDETDERTLALELDTYWAHRGGEDPGALLARLGGRCPLVHLKDASADGRSPEPSRPGVAHLATEVGTGVLDFRAVLAASSAEWHVVEQDEPRRHPPLESARISLENLRSLEGR